jgi:uncharacterized protein YhaN
MQLISSAKSSQAKLKQELSSFLKGLDFSAAVPEVADDEEVVDESDSEEDVAEEEEEEEEEAAEESEEDEDVNMSQWSRPRQNLLVKHRRKSRVSSRKVDCLPFRTRRIRRIHQFS